MHASPTKMLDQESGICIQCWIDKFKNFYWSVVDLVLTYSEVIQFIFLIFHYGVS